MPISKAQIKNIKSLHKSKFRKEKGLFIIEGGKLIAEAMNAGVIFDSIFVTNTALPREWKMELIAEHEMEQGIRFDTLTDVVDYLVSRVESLEEG